MASSRSSKPFTLACKNKNLPWGSDLSVSSTNCTVFATRMATPLEFVVKGVWNNQPTHGFLSANKSWPVRWVSTNTMIPACCALKWDRTALRLGLALMPRTFHVIHFYSSHVDRAQASRAPVSRARPAHPPPHLGGHAGPHTKPRTSRAGCYSTSHRTCGLSSAQDSLAYCVSPTSACSHNHQEFCAYQICNEHKNKKSTTYLTTSIRGT